jgi:hypothetical protein
MFKFLFFLLLTCHLALPAQSNTAAAAAVEEAAPKVSQAPVNELVFSIEHSFGGVYTHRTTVKVVTKADGKQSLVYPERNGIVGGDIDGFKKLLAENGLYRIKIRSSAANESDSSIVTSIPACELQKSAFKEDLTMYIDTSKNVMGVSYSSPVIALSRPCDPSKIKEPISFQTRIKFGEHMVAQVIPMQAFGQRPVNIPQNIKLNAEAEDTGHNAPPTKSFLQKYWYIVLALMLYLFLGGEDPKSKKEGETKGAAPAAGAKKTIAAKK